jgi:ABC-2 type transport system permease protein
VPFDERLLTNLPGVGGLEHRGDRVVVTGSTDLVGAVVGVLAKAGVTAHDVHLESGTLEDAFLALTGRTFVEPTEPEPTRARERRRGWGPGGTGTLAFALRRRSQGHRAPRSAFRELVRSEWRLTMRSPVGLVWGVGLPILLLVIFGSIPKLSEPAKNLGGLSFFEVYLPTLIALSLSLLALLSLPIPLASYREGRVLRRMATTPVSPSLVLGAQVAVNLVLLVAALLVIVVAGSLAFGAHAPRQVGGFVLSLVLAVLAMFALGVWVASVARSARAAGAVGGALFYPLAFFAGLWVPVQLMAGPLRVIARLTPLGAAVQGMLDSTEGHFPSPEPLLVMAAWAAVFGVASVRLFRWD